MNIGENIKLIRRTKGMTQEQLANALGYTKSFLSLVESGDRTLSSEDIARIAVALGVSVEDMQSRVVVQFRSDSISSSDQKKVEEDFIKFARNLKNSRN
ncbi:helix-turn-helix transcriptional regulator [Candidatus Uhrbacteria bacterium]|nr:helix-turn-helix transcriptional regulator [Candidatus Uhrbacteria bacterium]